MKKSGAFVLLLLFVAVALWALRSNRHTSPQITPPTKEPTVTPNSTAAPAWWTELSAVPDNTWVFTKLKYQAKFTPADIAFLQRQVETRDGQDLQRSSAILVSTLRGRFPVIIPLRQSLAVAMLALATNRYPDDERARYALNVLTYADRNAASQFAASLDFNRPLPDAYRRVVAEQLNAINTDASLAKLDQLLDSQGDAKLRIYVTRRTYRYVPIEELGQRWQKNHDIVTLNILCDDWLEQVYEGYPMDEVIAIMGQPQRQGPHYAYYASKEGPEFYIELNDARQIGGRSGPR